LPHIHLVNGQRVEVGASQLDTTSTSNAPALGAEAGTSASLVAGVVLTPTIIPLMVNRLQGERLSAEDAPLPLGRAEAPPVPPPLGASQFH
jgi:hypothetical protein